MASPQTGNGFTRIANELQEAFCKIRIPGEERQVLDVILRKTYGWNKKEDEISLSQFVLATGINKPNVCRALSKLIMKSMIIKKDNGVSVSYSIQKNYTLWKSLSKKITLSKQIMPVIKKDNKLDKIVIKKDTHKRKEYKDTITKEIIYMWNNFAKDNDLSNVKDIKKYSTRERNLKTRIKEDNLNFPELLEKIKEQPFLLGENDNGWRITFDWILLPSNYIKIMEEQYKDRGKKHRLTGDKNGRKNKYAHLYKDV